MFTGGSQFAFVGVISAGGLAAIPAAVASAALLGARNIAYGIRMSTLLPPGRFTRIAAPQFTIDESTAVALAQGTPRARTVGFWVTGIGIYLGWNLSTLAGALLGDVLGDPRAYGLDAAAAAAFLALLWPRLRGRQPIVVGIAAAVVATVLTPSLMPGLPVLIAALVAIVVGWADWGGGAAKGGAGPAGGPGVDSSLGSDGLDEPDDLPEREGLP